jgi:hypothetical protein
MSPRPDEDNIRIDHRLNRIGLNAIEAVAEHYKVDFFDLDIEGKKAFLNDHGKEVVEAAKSHATLGRYFDDRVVLWVENEGAAGLVFTKKVKHA